MATTDDSPDDGSFRFPAFHAFPPSYTKQPIVATREKQAGLWCDLIREYCRHHGIFWLDVAEAANSPLFVNQSINRRMKGDDIVYFLGQLVNRGDGMWDASKSRCLVFWRRPEEWGDIVYQWVEATGRNNTIMTIYELRQSDDVKGQSFYNLDLDLMMLALNALERSGKAAVFEGAKSDNLGVKFL
mmetsp:Transcript_11111/g.19014  ORF Transcript_11111/g.19014 Transcript_11111/m.19014 type:complete len:186 (+) Transcript_11111:130-687(+)